MAAAALYQLLLLVRRRASVTACVREARVRARDGYTDTTAFRYREKAIEQLKKNGEQNGQALAPA